MGSSPPSSQGRSLGFAVQRIARDQAVLAHMELRGRPRVDRDGAELPAFERAGLLERWPRHNAAGWSWLTSLGRWSWPPRPSGTRCRTCRTRTWHCYVCSRHQLLHRRRRVATELGVDPMALYRHVKSKDALLDGVVELLWRQVPPPQAAVAHHQPVGQPISRPAPARPSTAHAKVPLRRSTIFYRASCTRSLRDHGRPSLSG